MTDYSTRYLVPTFNGLVAQIGLSIGVSAVCAGLFEYNRRKKTLEYLYSPRCRLSVNPSPPVSRRFFGWIMPTIRLPEEFYLEKVGLDAVMYLRFLKMCLQFCIFNGVIVGTILLPIHYTARGGLSEVPRLSIENVPSDSNLLWTHVVLTYVVTVSWMFLLFKNYWQWMDLRREYTLQRIQQGEIAERSIFISRLPSNLRSDEALRQYFESLKMGPVEFATVVQHCGRLSQKIDRRESALNMLEKSHIELACSVLCAIKSGQFPVGLSKTPAAGPLHNGSSASTHAATITDYASVREMVLELFGDKKQYNKTRKSIFEKKRQTTSGSSARSIESPSDTEPALGPQADAVAETKAGIVLEAMAAVSPSSDPEATHHATIDIVVHQQDSGLDRDEGPGHFEGHPGVTVWQLLAALPRQSLDVFQPTRPEKRFKGGARINSIDYFLRKYNRLDRKVEEVRSDSLRYKPTSFGFVTFRHHLSAQLCAQSKIDSRPQGLSVCLAMEPRDVLWSNLTASFRNRFTRSIAVNISIWALIIFWIFPTSSFLLLTSLGALSSRFTFLKPILEASPLIQSLLQNVLPIVFVTIFLAFAPVIILAISKQELPVSHSALEGKVLRRYYHFLIFNVLFVFMIGTAVLKSIITLIQKPTNIFTLLAESLPSGSTFFVFYIVFNTCTHFLELLQVWAQLVIHIFVTARRLTGTPRSLQRATAPWSFQYYYYYPQNILAFVITLIYSLISPLILLAAVVFFGSALLIFKYQFAYCYIRKYENSGRYFRHVFQYTSDGLIIFQLTMIGVLWLKEALVGGFFVVALLGFTIYFKILCTDLLRSRTKYLPLDTGLRDFGSEHAPFDDEPDHEESGSFSTQSSKTSSVLRQRKRGIIVKGADASGGSPPVAAGSAPLGGSNTSLTSLGQSRTFSRLCVSAGQSDRYEKLVHGDSTENVSRGARKEHSGANAIEESTLDEKAGHESPTLPNVASVPNQDKMEEGKNVVKDEMLSTAVVTSGDNVSTFEDGFLADNGFFTSALGQHCQVYAYPTVTPHFEHKPSRMVYQDNTSEFETYLHPALLKPLSRKLWLPRNPLYEHWDLSDTVEIDFTLNSSANDGKPRFRAPETEGTIHSTQPDRRDQRMWRNNDGASFEETAGVAPVSPSWEGCLAHFDSEAADKPSNGERRASEAMETMRAQSGVAEGRQNTYYGSPQSTHSMPLADTSVISRRRLSIPLETASNIPQRPHVSPLAVAGTTRSREKVPKLRSSPHGPSSCPQSPGIFSVNTTTATATSRSAIQVRSKTLDSMRPCHTATSTHPEHNHLSMGSGTGAGNSAHQTQPKSTRGLLNMIFGGYNDEDGDDCDEKPRFGYETGGAWLSRRASHDNHGDDDDDDDDDDERQDRDGGRLRQSGRGDNYAVVDDESGLGLAERQTAPPSHVDLSDPLADAA